jgi:hypothetical protein
MKKFNLSFLVSAILLLLIVGCSKKDDDKNEPPEVAKLAIQEKLDEIEVPANLANSTSLYAVQVNLYVALIKGIASYFYYFDPVDGATYEDGNYYWTYGGQSIWMDYSETSDAYVYKMDVDLGAGRVNYITSEEKKDGSGGFLHIYDYTDAVDGDFVFEYAWDIDSDGNVKVTFKDSEENDVLELYGSPDDSGYVKSYTGGLLDFELVWNSDGTGYMNEYDEQGNKTSEEIWTLDDL